MLVGRRCSDGKLLGRFLAALRDPLLMEVVMEPRKEKLLINIIKIKFEFEITTIRRFSMLEASFDHNLFANVSQSVGDGAGGSVAAEYVAHVPPCNSISGDIRKIPIHKFKIN